ncbi:PALP domain-containing protein [Fusarium sp. LHS14.1]|nr:PALP domain-containing protein [Fusarium sp. LHS14.1]
MAPPIVKNVLDAIGNTPCVRLKKVVPEGCADVYLKLEYFNPTGSYKDRMANSIIQEAEKSGGLKPGMTVVEASGGSSGSSLALVCAAKEYNCHIVTSNAFAVEKLRTMSAFGTHVEIIHSPSGKIHADLIPSMIRRVTELSKDPQMYWTDQFNNRDAFEVDAFCGAVGTAGMAIGVSSVLKDQWPECRVAVLEPASSPRISEGEAGAHHIEGIGIGIIPPLLDETLCDHAWALEEQEARAMCRRLAKEEGLLVGTSTGLNVVGAIRLAQELGLGKTVVTVACDTGLKYMNGDLFTAS